MPVVFKTISFLFVFLFSQQLAAYTPGKVYKLTILHTNDHHGRFWPNDKGELGLAARATLIEQQRQLAKREGRHVLLLDAGDVNSGTPQSDMQDAEPDFKGMAMLGYDVMAVGNHEFDNPFATLLKQQQWANFPFISANIYYKNTKKRVFPSHVTKELDDLKVVVFGLTTEDTPVKSDPNNTRDFKFVAAVEEAKSLVPKLRSEADVLIALTHMGHYANGEHGADAPGDVTLARNVDGIDLIVGGHSQKPLHEADVQNGTLIVQAHEWGKFVGRVDLEFLDGKLKLVRYELIPVNLEGSSQKFEEKKEVADFLRPFKEKGDESLQVKVGKTNVRLEGDREIVRSQETNLGNLIACAYRKKLEADLSILNSGGIRGSIEAGDITYESVLTVLPFGSEIVLASLSGQELKDYLEEVILTMVPGMGGFPQFSGLSAVVDRANGRLSEIRLNGKRLCLKRTYRLALPSFIANGGDKFPKLQSRSTGFIDADILKNFIQEFGVIKEEDFKPSGYLKELK